MSEPSFSRAPAIVQFPAGTPPRTDLMLISVPYARPLCAKFASVMDFPSLKMSLCVTVSGSLPYSSSPRGLLKV